MKRPTDPPRTRLDRIRSGAYDISDPAQRSRAMRDYLWRDHAILRYLWTNFYQVAPGVYRSNQPTDGQLRKYARMGIRTIVSLRPPRPSPAYQFEKESCDRLGLTLINIQLHSRMAPSAENLLELLRIFRRVERPMLMHCKSGADRAGLASTIYLMVIEGEPLERARRMLSPRFIHFKWMKTGVLDLLLDRFAADHAASGIGFEEWVATRYDAAETQAAFDAQRKARRICARLKGGR